MELGDYIRQIGTDFVSYGLIIQRTKKSFIAIIFTCYNGRITGKAKKKSISEWYPIPIVISEKDIPHKILGKIKERIF